MKKTMAAAVVLAAATLLAAPAVKMDPVAPGFPAWQGLTSKSYICGREIEPSDLRHKVTIVVEFTPNEKQTEQLLLAGKLAGRGLPASFGHGVSWETVEIPRNVITVFSVRNAKHEAVMEALKTPKGDQATAQAMAALKGQGCSFYDDVTFAGAPDNEGKLPFVYVMGPTGTEPLFKGELDAAGVKGANEAVSKGLKEIDGWEQKWRPFFGNIAEPKFNTSIAKVLEKGKNAKKAPLGPVEKALLTDIKSKDEEKARESQILYDALVQTRNDLILRIRLEVGACPHRAYYDVQTLLKYWPTVTKQLEGVAAKMKANPEVDMMGKIFMKLMTWGDPEFTCKPSEAKKIIVELNKMKKSLSSAKESKNITVQDGALLLDMRIDEMIPIMQSRAEAK